jgi:hypothetical protein
MLSRIISLPVNHAPNRHPRSLARIAIGFSILLSGFAVAAGHLLQLVSGSY